MKNLVIIFITALLAWLSSYYVGWWMIVVVPFLIIILLKNKPARGFLTGFIAIGTLWLYLILEQDLRNKHILSGQFAMLIGLPHIAFLIVNVIIGAVAGGLGGWCGALLRRAVSK